MKHLLLLLLPLLPLASLAQSGPRNYVQQNQQSRDYFNRSMNQRATDFQNQQLLRNRPGPGGTRSLVVPSEAQARARAKQQAAEQEANAKYASLVQQQQQRRQEQPAKNPQQAEARQTADNQQLNLLAVKNYHDVFLAGQVAAALEARTLSPKAQQSWGTLTDNLMSDAWWSKQQGAQLPEKLRACGDTLTTLATGLLGFDLASPPPTPAQLAPSRIDEMLATGAFDQRAAAQLIQEVSSAEKLIAGKGLAEAVLEFQKLTGAPSQALLSNPKKLRKEVAASLRQATEEMYAYETRLASLARLSSAKEALLKSTARYVAKNSK